MAKVLSMRPNGSPQYIQDYTRQASPAETTGFWSKVFAWDTQEYGDNTSIRLESFFSAVNNANLKNAILQVSNTPDFAVRATISNTLLTSLAAAKGDVSLVFRRGANLRPYVIAADGAVTELTTIDRTKRLYFRWGWSKGTAGDALALEGFRFTLLREMYDYKYNVNLN